MGSNPTAPTMSSCPFGGQRHVRSACGHKAVPIGPRAAALCGVAWAALACALWLSTRQRSRTRTEEPTTNRREWAWVCSGPCGRGHQRGKRNSLLAHAETCGAIETNNFVIVQFDSSGCGSSLFRAFAASESSQKGCFAQISFTEVRRFLSLSPGCAKAPIRPLAREPMRCFHRRSRGS